MRVSAANVPAITECCLASWASLCALSSVALKVMRSLSVSCSLPLDINFPELIFSSKYSNKLRLRLWWEFCFHLRAGNAKEEALLDCFGFRTFVITIKKPSQVNAP